MCLPGCLSKLTSWVALVTSSADADDLALTLISYFSRGSSWRNVTNCVALSSSLIFHRIAPTMRPKSCHVADTGYRLPSPLLTSTSLHRTHVAIMRPILSVQCNTLHGTEYKITCGVFVCASTGFGGHVSRKRLEIEVRFQWDTDMTARLEDT